MPTPSFKSSPVAVVIDGVPAMLERLPDGTIRVTHESQQVNPMHGLGTGGEVMYVVHPVQKQHFDFLNNLLPTETRVTQSLTLDNRPWWSYAANQKDAKHRDKGDAGE